jgi:hypothetical protein
MKHYRRFTKYGDPLAGPKFVEESRGQGKDPLYRLWRSIITRCANPNTPSYHRYGGRGITIYDPWINSFLTWKSWIIRNLGERPPGAIFDRIDNNGNYEPGNVKWSTKVESANNTSTNTFIEYRNRTKSLAQWSRITGISRITIRNRLAASWTIEKTLTTKPEKYNRGTKPRTFTLDGETRSLKDWAKHFNVSFARVNTRIYVWGWDLERALKTPPEDQAPTIITVNGITKTKTEWARESGVKAPTIAKRLERGLTGEDIISPERSVAIYKKPYRHDALLITYNGETKSVTEFAREYGLDYATLRLRLMDLKWPVERALKTPPGPQSSKYRKEPIIFK